MKKTTSIITFKTCRIIAPQAQNSFLTRDMSIDANLSAIHPQKLCINYHKGI